MICRIAFGLAFKKSSVRINSTKHEGQFVQCTLFAKVSLTQPARAFRLVAADAAHAFVLDWHLLVDQLSTRARHVN